MSGRFLEHNFPHVCGIDRNPTVAAEVDFRAAVLRSRHILRRGAEALVSHLRLRDADSVHVARRKASRAREANVESIQIGALAAEVLRLQHEADIADATAARFRIPKRVVNNPLVDRASFVDVRLGAARDFGRGGFHDTVGRQELGRL
jgi:hypothetical protein